MRILITGGGTEECINPGLSIAKELSQRHSDAKVLFVGSKKGIEGPMIKEDGFDFKTVETDYFKKKLSLENIKCFNKVVNGMGDANRIINEFVPDVVIGTGGYICGPVVLMASLKGVKTAVYEQHKVAGKTVKILSRFVDRVFTDFEGLDGLFKSKSKIIYTGQKSPSDDLYKGTEVICSELERLVE